MQVQQVMGRYQVIKTLFQGNTSITYLAWRDGRSLVIKTLNSDWVSHAEARTFLEQEAKILHQLRHPGLPRLIDFFWLEGRPYLVREMVYGQDLSQYISHQGVLSQSQAIAWMLQVCEVLHYLHQKVPSVLHQDIKPSNLIRRSTPHGNWEISLVGLKAASTLTESGTQIGLPAYTAPEQQEGHPIPASDLYSLGPTLVYLLTGQEPRVFL